MSALVAINVEMLDHIPDTQLMRLLLLHHRCDCSGLSVADVGSQLEVDAFTHFAVWVTSPSNWSDRIAPRQAGSTVMICPVLGFTIPKHSSRYNLIGFHWLPDAVEGSDEASCLSDDDGTNLSHTYVLQ